MRPSPPLLPGPQRTMMREGAATIVAALSATAAPARRINSIPGTPAAMAVASILRIASTVIRRCGGIRNFALSMCPCLRTAHAAPLFQAQSGLG